MVGCQRVRLDGTDSAQHGHSTIDTARAYGAGTSEEVLGKTDVAKWATIDTKVASFVPGAHSAEKIKASIEASVSALAPAEINILYLHAPDRATPFAETIEEVNKAYKDKKFAEFGLSNYSPEEVEQIVKLCADNNWVKPSVYQGQYNAISRLSETDLLPVLRKHNIKYYAYSPSASGIFTGKLSAQSTEVKGGRFDSNSNVGKLYSGQYLKPELLDAAAKVHKESEARGISGHEVALRWVLHHSALDASKGDAMIIGASSMKQLEENLRICEQGRLPDELLQLLESTWDVAKDVAPSAHH
jgi:aflatoxin B1 aldehyde reductase